MTSSHAAMKNGGMSGSGRRARAAARGRSPGATSSRRSPGFAAPASFAPTRIAVAGNSFGGIETVLGAEREPYCAAVDAAGRRGDLVGGPGATDRNDPGGTKRARAGLLLSGRERLRPLPHAASLSAAMKDAGKPFEAKIYPPFGRSHSDGHSFAYRGGAIWFDDVFRFVERHCAPAGGGAN